MNYPDEIQVVSESTSIDKAGWGNGEWLNEPDKIHFVDKRFDTDCLAVRGPHGGWCGYVSVESSHPAFGHDYDRVNVEVHGGLTYGDFCQEDAKPLGICHVPRSGKEDRVYWLGFDCAHAGDYSPKHGARFGWRGDTYKTASYVIMECLSLSRQLSERNPISEPHEWEKA